MEAEEKIVRITFDKSIFRWDKEEEASQLIKEIESEGWRFKEARPTKFTESVLHMGGALNLHFTKMETDNKDGDQVLVP